jgi:hypothetical protein
LSRFVNAVRYSDSPTVPVSSIPEETATHGPRLWLVSLLAASATALMYVAWLENKPTDEWRDEFAVGLRVSILLAIAAIFAIAAVWIACQRVIVDSQEIASRGIFGEKRMRWDQIREFYYFEGKFLFFVLPIPLPVAFLRPYWFVLVDSVGQKLRCGPGLSRRELLASELIERSRPHLLQSAIELFDNGVEVSFGPIAISRQYGIRTKKDLREREFPLSELYSHGFEEGHFYLWRVGEEKTGIPIEKIPNVFALDDFLKLARER